MNISSRTPDGSPGHCPICGRVVFVEPSSDHNDAPCPNCGALLTWFNRRLAKLFRATGEEFDPEMTLDEAGLGSLDVVELVMELEEEFGLEVPDEDAERFKTLGDLIRYLSRRLRF